ncbi:urease accessory protein UreD [Methylibium sp.]|uniref:urease accessory protein UreD n=1 Tax=Methylibium sp. TaxID=2067992 RepID=UPI00333E5D37
MAWLGSLDLHYRLDPDAPAAAAPRTIGRGVHSGPLRVLQSLYPEGPGICHHVLVHPPGGIVSGDELALTARVDTGAHALLTTPGATRFYRSGGDTALQTLTAWVSDGARLEWLPLETLVHDGARARNALRFELAPGAEMIGWDLLALGLPAAGERYASGCFEQSIEVRSAAHPLPWLERGVLDFDDPRHAPTTRRLLASPLGWAGHTVLATLWFASGTALASARREALIDAARTPDSAAAEPGAEPLGVTAPHDHVVVLRMLGARVEPLMQRLRAVRGRWRRLAWDCAGAEPRVWRT